MTKSKTKRRRADERRQATGGGGKRPNIVFFFWDNFGWGELGCYGGGDPARGADAEDRQLAAEGQRLLNFNVEAQCTPSRSALLTGRHPMRSGTQTVPITGGKDGTDAWEVTSAKALSDAGYATGMWGKWHLGSDPDSRSPVDFGFDEAVWCPRTADEVLWTMQSYFPDGAVTAAPYAGERQIPLEPEPIYSRKKGEKAKVLATYDAEFRAGFDRKITEWAIDFMTRSKEAGKPFYMYLPYTQVHIPPIPDPEFAGKSKRGNIGRPADPDGRLHRDDPGQTRRARARRRHHRRVGLRQRRRPELRCPAMDPDPLGGQWTAFSGPWRGGLLHLARRVQPTPVHRPLAGQGARGQGEQRARASGRLVRDALLLAAGAKVPADRRSTAWTCATSCSATPRSPGRDSDSVHPGQPAAGREVAPMEGAPVPTGRIHVDLDAVQHAASSTTSSGTRARSTRSTSRTPGSSTRSPPPSARS